MSLALGLFMGKIVTLASVVGQNRFPGILLSLTEDKLADFFISFLGEELCFFLSVMKSSFLRWWESLDGFNPDGLMDLGLDDKNWLSPEGLVF